MSHKRNRSTLEESTGDKATSYSFRRGKRGRLISTVQTFEQAAQPEDHGPEHGSTLSSVLSPTVEMLDDHRMSFSLTEVPVIEHHIAPTPAKPKRGINVRTLNCAGDDAESS